MYCTDGFDSNIQNELIVFCISQMSGESNEKFRFSIDRGGTFTDIYAEVPGGRAIVRKLLSIDPSNYRDAPTKGIRRIFEEFTGLTFHRIRHDHDS